MGLLNLFGLKKKAQNKEQNGKRNDLLATGSPDLDASIKETVSENDMVAAVYHKMNQDDVQNLFYGGEKEAASILLPLGQKLFQDFGPTEKQLSDASYFYTQVWVRKHGGSSPEFSSTPYIKEAMKNRFPDIDKDIVVQGVEMCLEYIYKHEPSLSEIGTEINTNEIRLPSSDTEYINSYKMGADLFDKGCYPQAIDAFRACLKIKEDDTASRFEIVEAYIAMTDWTNAKYVLHSTVPFISTLHDKAKLYRRLAFIEIETSYFDLAAAALLYSLQFENNERALRELMYIKSITGKDYDWANEKIIRILEGYGMLFWDPPE